MIGCLEKKKASVTTPLTYKKVQISHFQLEARGESTQKTTTKTLGAALFFANTPGKKQQCYVYTCR